MQNQISNISPLANSQSPIANGRDTKRLPWLDFASGIMILWMIVYHAISSAWCYELEGYLHLTDLSLLPAGLHAILNSEGKLQALNPCVVIPWLHFFMPWFFYKSGMFFKKQTSKDLWQKDRKKLLKTFVIWSAIGFAVYVLIGLLNHTITLRAYTYSVVRGLFLTGKVPLNTPLWFLLTLFGVRAVANKLLPDKEDKYAWMKIAAVVLVGYVVSYLAYRFHHRLLPYWIANGAAGLSFFALGYAIRDVETKWWLIVPCAIVYILGSIFGFPIVDMWPNEVVAGSYLLWIPVAFCCIVTFNAVCRWITQYVRVKPIEWVGQNAMTIYVVHILIVTLFIELVLRRLNITIPSLWVVGLITAVYAAVLPICCWAVNKLKI